MQKKKSYLVTTSLESTWADSGDKNIFLGEWCKTYNKRELWLNLDYEIVKPFGLNFDQRENDQNKIKHFEGIMLDFVSEQLNTIHNLNFSTRYWNIILGLWLRRYIETIYNRFYSIKSVLEKRITLYTKLINFPKYSLVTNDSLTFIWATNDNVWNHYLYSMIMKYLNSPLLILESQDIDFDEAQYKSKAVRIKTLPFQVLKKRVLDKIFRFQRRFQRTNDGVIVNSYLPYLIEIKLYLSLKQFPQINKGLFIKESLDSKETLVDKQLRDQLSEDILNGKDNDEFLTFLKYIFFKILPVCYLENFKKLNQIVNDSGLPKFPKFIFTSNNFDTDEFFKVWTAAKVLNGTKYYIGQHGNNYGTFRYMNPSKEEEVADKFFTWGWKSNLPSHIPTFNLKIAGRKRLNYDRDGKLLLVQFPLRHRVFSWDVYAEFEHYFEDQKRLILELKPEIRKDVIVRLHSQSFKRDWYEDIRWKDFDSTLEIEAGIRPIEKLIRKSRIVVHTYDSTGILETLALNYPTLAFWQNGFNHLNENVKPVYKRLVDSGIVHLGSESLARKINDIWNSVDFWWNSNEVQRAREDFCNLFSKTVDNPVEILTREMK